MRYVEYVSEKEGIELGHESRGEKHKQHTQCHPEAPHHGDGRVLAHLVARRQPLYRQRRPDGKHSGHHYGADTEVVAQSQAAETGMCDTAGDRRHAPGHHVGPNYGRGHRDDQHPYQGVGKKAVSYQFTHRLMCLYIGLTARRLHRISAARQRPAPRPLS